MNYQELKQILIDHKLYLHGKTGRRANLSDLDLRGVDLRGVDLCGADLGHANLSGADLRGTNLGGANLRGANLREVSLDRANLRDANLIGANLSSANLSSANLSDANLRDANLRDANLRDARLLGADMWDTVGNRREIKNIDYLPFWGVTYTSTHMQIGCQNHRIKDWGLFNDGEIDRMDCKALEFWSAHKDEIFSVLEKHPAIPTIQD